MTQNEKAKWHKIYQLGRNRFIWFRGVLCCGILTAVLWSFVMSYIKGAGTGFWDYFLIAIFIFPVGGYIWGSWMWKRCEFSLHQSSTLQNESLFGTLDPSIFPIIHELPNGKYLSVSMKPAVKVAWICVALFSSFLILSLFIGQFLLSLPFLFFIALGVFLLLNSGSININSLKICLNIPFGHYEIDWDEVENIETDIQRGALVFSGNNKRVVIAGPVWWAGPDKMALISFLNVEIERRGIEIKRSQKALFKMSKN